MTYRLLIIFQILALSICTYSQNKPDKNSFIGIETSLPVSLDGDIHAWVLKTSINKQIKNNWYSGANFSFCKGINEIYYPNASLGINLGYKFFSFKQCTPFFNHSINVDYKDAKYITDYYNIDFSTKALGLRLASELGYSIPIKDRFEFSIIFNSNFLIRPVFISSIYDGYETVSRNYTREVFFYLSLGLNYYL